MPPPTLTARELDELLGPLPAVSILHQVEEYRLSPNETPVEIARRVFIREALGRAAGNQSIAAKALGILPCSLSTYLAGRRKALGPKAVKRSAA